MASQVLIQTLVFDGRAENYRLWHEKLDLCQPCLTDTQLKTHIKSKLSAEPLNFIVGLGDKADTAVALLNCLSEEYDPYRKPMYVESCLASLSQGTKTIEDHHAYLSHLLRGLGEMFETTSRQIRASYIASLADSKVR